MAHDQTLPATELMLRSTDSIDPGEVFLASEAPAGISAETAAIELIRKIRAMQPGDTTIVNHRDAETFEVTSWLLTLRPSNVLDCEEIQ